MKLIHFVLCVSAEARTQNNSTVVMGAVIGVAVILLVVVAVLLLRKRLVATLLARVQIHVIYTSEHRVIMCHELK